MKGRIHSGRLSCCPRSPTVTPEKGGRAHGGNLGSLRTQGEGPAGGNWVPRAPSHERPDSLRPSELLSPKPHRHSRERRAGPRGEPRFPPYSRRGSRGGKLGSPRAVP